jgi:zinc protease
VSRIPALGVSRPLTLPESAETIAPSGLHVLAIRRRGEPLAELRLRIPFAGVDGARARLLAQTLTAGTTRVGPADLAAAVAGLGGALTADADPDRLLISGRSLGAGLDRLLAILGDVLVDACFPPDEMTAARCRVGSALRVAGAQPTRLAEAALARTIYPGHPYGAGDPAAHEIQAVTREDLLEVHRTRVRPRGADLILVGDFDPAAVVDAAVRRLADWTGGAAEPGPRRPPPIPALAPGPVLVEDLPGAAQSCLRIALPAVPRGHPDNAALRLANLVFGGYFSSRWTANLRERRGYAYGPRSAVRDLAAGSRLIAQAEVSTAVTAPALAETLYELGRLACLPPSRAEVDRARRYTVGALAVLGMATHRALADLAADLAGSGLPLSYLTAYVEQLGAAGVEDVHEAAFRYLAPAGAVTVILGDAARIGHAVGALVPVTVRRGAREVSGEKDRTLT